MKLQLKENFEINKETRHTYMSVRPVNGGMGSAFVSFVDTQVRAYPHGGSEFEEFDSLAEAHDYLLRVGSESPFYDADELQAAAESEGPATEDDAEACREHRASLHRIQVVDDLMNMCRCVQVPVVLPAPRPCAVDRLEAAGYFAQPVTGLLWLRHDTAPGIAVEYIGTRQARAGIDSPHLRIKGDCCDGLNAALESLLSKPVGAVTVAAILGVA
jgi:hypothetical protein